VNFDLETDAEIGPDVYTIYLFDEAGADFVFRVRPHAHHGNIVVPANAIMIGTGTDAEGWSHYRISGILADITDFAVSVSPLSYSITGFGREVVTFRNIDDTEDLVFTSNNATFGQDFSFRLSVNPHYRIVEIFVLY
jgi:hypothetical protein